jgi:hypothetical protein
MQLTIALAFTLVFDKALNRGQVTIHLYDSTADARDWIVRSGDEIASSFTGFLA